MYFPKSQIKTNLSTSGGEFIYASDGTDYFGFYFQTSTGEFYTGKTPNDKPNLPLISTEKYKENNPQDQIFSTPSIQTTPQNNIWTWDYYDSPLPMTKVPYNPTQTFPILKESDYKIGEFQRYFVSKTNEPKFIEINKEQYDKYTKKDSEVAYQLYEPLSLPWELTGDRNKVYNTNKKTVERTQQRLNLRGFKSYFRERYDQFYK
jgi:hypothetical protein